MHQAEYYFSIYIFFIGTLSHVSSISHYHISGIEYRQHNVARRSVSDLTTEQTRSTIETTEKKPTTALLEDTTTQQFTSFQPTTQNQTTESTSQEPITQQQTTESTTHKPTAQQQTTDSTTQKPTTQQQTTESTTQRPTGQQQTTKSATLNSISHHPTATSQPENTTTITDHHTYYKSKIFPDPNGLYWNELHRHTRHSLSNDKHRSYSFISTSFKFPFYGHMIQDFAITPLGFLYMSRFTHPNLDFSYTHYIAPLMANFDTTGSHSEILYKDDGNSIVIEWRNVELNDQEEFGNYTFQTTIYKNGTIMFVYKSIPETNISATNWQVKVGLSDAFYYDVLTYFGYMRYIFKYHTVELNATNIQDNLVIIFDPVPTCNLATSCEQCTSLKIDFNCSWCHGVSKCSDGLDWHRQDWLDKSCLTKAVRSGNMCNIATNSPIASPVSSVNPGNVFTSDDAEKSKSSKSKEREGAKKTALIVVPMVVAVLLIIMFIVVWVIYARSHPMTKSGQWLIKNRPSKWKGNLSNISFSKTSKGDKIRIEDYDAATYT